MNVSRKEAYLKLSRYFGKQGEDEYEDLVEVLYQSPQLSDDVELLIDDFNNVVNRCNRGNIHSNRLTLLGLSNEIKQHIQAQANDIEEYRLQKRFIDNANSEFKELYKDEYLKCKSKLNKISAIMDSAYKQSENGMNFDSTYYFNQILEVLEELT